MIGFRNVLVHDYLDGEAVGARANFMKMAPILREMARDAGEFEQIPVQTGQRDDANMSQVLILT